MTDQAQANPLPAPPPVSATGPTGIGGWLVLPMLGMIATPILQLIQLSSLGSTLGNVSSLGPLVSNLIWIETLLNFGLFVVAPGLLLIQFFGKRRAFPRWYIAWTAASAVFVVVDLMVGYAAFHQAYEASGTPFFDRDTLRALASALVGACVWIPYMLNSVRVKNTFIN
jgi:hypothetical protein